MPIIQRIEVRCDLMGFWLFFYFMELEIEIWKDIKGFERCYQVSNFGNVRSLDRYSGKGFLKGRLLKCYNPKNSYKRITLESNCVKKSFTVHRLVAESFVENPLKKLFVNHIDGKKHNAASSNLEWVTLNENMKHAFDTGLLDNVKILKGLKGESSPVHKLSDIDILMIKCLHNGGFSYKMIAKKFNVHSTHIGLIVRLKSRKELEFKTELK